MFMNNENQLPTIVNFGPSVAYQQWHILLNHLLKNR